MNLADVVQYMGARWNLFRGKKTISIQTILRTVGGESDKVFVLSESRMRSVGYRPDCDE
jgi:hypothetical protein